MMHQSGRHAAGSGLRRLSLAADVLVATAGVEPEHADAIVRAHELSLAFRRRMSGGPFGFGWVTSPRPTLRQHQAGPFTAISIGERVPVTVDSRPAEVFLLALVSSPQRAEITYLARLPPLDQPTGARDEDEEDDRHLIVDFFSDITVTDDHLGSYDLSCASDDYDGGLLTGRFCQGKTALPGLDVVADDLLRDDSPSEADLALIVTTLTETGVIAPDDQALLKLGAWPVPETVVREPNDANCQSYERCRAR